jgi:hypothetical protein
MPLTKVNGQMLDGAITADSSGNVGIGTSSPPSNTNLTVLGNFSSGFYRNVTSGGRGYFINIGAKTSGGFADGAYVFGAVDSGDATGYLTFGTRSSSATAERMRIDSSGRVTMPYQPAFRAFTGTVFTGSTVVVFDTTQFNTGNHYSTSTGRFTAPIAGRYFFTFYILSAAGYTGSFWGGIRRNGTSIAFAEIDWPGNFRTIATSTVVELAAGDYIDVLLAQGSNYAGGGTYGEWNAFSGYLIG